MSSEKENIITLSTPILVDGSMTTTLKVNKAKFDDFIQFQKPVAEKDPFSNNRNAIVWRPASELEIAKRMIQKMANLNEVEVSLLSLDAAMEISELLTPFLGSLTPQVTT